MCCVQIGVRSVLVRLLCSHNRIPTHTHTTYKKVEIVTSTRGKRMGSSSLTGIHTCTHVQGAHTHTVPDNAVVTSMYSAEPPMDVHANPITTPAGVTGYMLCTRTHTLNHIHTLHAVHTLNHIHTQTHSIIYKRVHTGCTWDTACTLPIPTHQLECCGLRAHTVQQMETCMGTCTAECVWTQTH